MRLEELGGWEKALESLKIASLVPFLLGIREGRTNIGGE